MVINHGKMQNACRECHLGVNPAPYRQIIFAQFLFFQFFIVFLHAPMGVNSGCPNGGIGRHAGLKILWTERSVPVRPRFRVLGRRELKNSLRFLF